MLPVSFRREAVNRSNFLYDGEVKDRMQENKLHEFTEKNQKYNT